MQSLPDSRGVPLEHVGVTRVPLPIKIKEKSGGYQEVRALTNLFVEVPSDIRGTHLSRLVEALTEWAEEPVDSTDIERLLEKTVESCASLSAEVDIVFSYFIQKPAPVTKRTGYMDYECEFRGRFDDTGFHFILGAKIPVTTLCPCSKEISDQGAHNQRSVVSVEISYRSETHFVWLEDLFATVEEEASCAVYPILKRLDEKYVTEAAYNNPKFVEDVVRDVILALRAAHPGLTWLSVECESQESIHGHNAFAGSKHAVLSESAQPEFRGTSEAQPHRQLSRSLR